MQALILAAGMGKRLKELTADNAKCMVRVGNETLIERAVRILDRKKLDRIIVVLGYEGEKLKNHILQSGVTTKLEFIDNPIFAETNNIYSFWLAKDYMRQDDTVLLESDLIFEEAVIDLLLEDARPSLALVDKRESWMDGTCVTLDASDRILDFVPGKKLDLTGKNQYYKTVNIYKFSKAFLTDTYIPFLEAYMSAMGRGVYYETVLGLVAQLENCELRAKRLEGQVWYEIDDVQDLHIAESLFAHDAGKRYRMIISRKGGNWRYPKLIDYSVPHNAYYPSGKMVEEMTANAMELVSAPASEITRIRELLGKYYGIQEDYVRAVGSISAIEEAFIAGGVDYTILTDPVGVRKLFAANQRVESALAHAAGKNSIVLVDETALEAVVSGGMGSYLTNERLEQYEDVLIVYKDLGRALGAPGLSVSMAAGAGERVRRLLDQIETDRISSFAEFFLQIAEKYKGEYEASLLQMRKDFESFTDGLADVSYVKRCDGLLDIIVCELEEETDARQLIRYLFENNLLVSDLSEILGEGTNCIGLAVRTEAENQMLLSKLIEYEKKNK